MASQDPQAARHARGEPACLGLGRPGGTSSGQPQAGGRTVQCGTRELAQIGSRQVRHEPVQFAQRLRGIRQVQTLMELLSGKPPGGHALTQGRDRPVTVRVGGAHRCVLNHR